MTATDTLFSVLAVAGPYIATCASVALLITLHRLGKGQSVRDREAADQRAQSAERRLEVAEAALRSMQSQLADVEEQLQLSSGAPAKSWTNINRRTQAVRMLRGGDKPSQVAAELSMSRAEVELIRKVHSLTSNIHQQGTGPAAPQGPSIFPIGG